MEESCCFKLLRRFSVAVICNRKDAAIVFADSMLGGMKLLWLRGGVCESCANYISGV